MQSFDSLFPQRIVCLTEETTEWLYLLGQEARIVGISGYTVRPRRARAEKPRVSAFTSAKIDQILALRPDCVIGFSDMQADIAAALIRAGVQVTVFNQRSVADIRRVLWQVAALVDALPQAVNLLHKWELEAQEIKGQMANYSYQPKVYFEEWDTPRISAIAWVSELIDMAGGRDIFPELAAQPLGKGRILADDAEILRRDPDIIIGSWCGKKFRPEQVAARPGWEGVAAVRTGQIFEIKSADILQPGPAALTDGLAQLQRIVLDWQRTVGSQREREAA